MSIYVLVTIALVFLFLFLFIFKIAKSIIKTLLFFFILTFILTGVFSYLIYSDFKDLTTNINQKPSILIIMKENEPLSLIQISTNNENSMIELTSSKYDEIKNNITKGKIDDLLKEYYKIILFKMEMLEEAPLASATIAEKNITKEQAKEAINSNNPKKTLNLEEVENPNNVFKMIIFLSYVPKDELESNAFFFKQYQKGNIIIYKETIIFKFIKNIPYFLIEEQLKKAL